MKTAPFLTVIFTALLLSISSCNKGSENGDIITLTTENFSSEIAQGVVMVDFWATWCMPCKAMAPVIAEIAGQTKGKVKVGKLDIDKNGPIANQYGIQAIPTILIFKDGLLVETLVGIQSKAALVNALSKHVPLQ
jgi:thioredoxin 1